MQYILLLILLVNAVFAQNIQQISAGNSHTLMLIENKVYGWGNNEQGQLGNNSNRSSYIPVQSLEIENIKVIASSYNHNLALMDDKTVWAWGENNFGQLGNNSQRVSFVPTQVNNLKNIKNIATGVEFSLALDANNILYLWGKHPIDSKIYLTPIIVFNSPENIIDIKAGHSYMVFLTADNTVWQWGLINGVLYKNPTIVQGVKDIKAIATGMDHILALDKHGVVFAWGNNYQGQLGDASFISAQNPIRVINLSNIKRIGAGSTYSVAINDQGVAFIWGEIEGSHCGATRFYQAYNPGFYGNAPIQIKALKNIKNIKAVTTGGCHVVVVTLDNQVITWGLNHKGQLGYRAEQGYKAADLISFD